MSTRFEAGKGIAHRKMEINNTMASITRRFKSNEMVRIDDIDYVIEQAEAVKKTLLEWNEKRARELGKVVKTP